MREPMDVRPFANLLGVGVNTVTNYELENTPPDRMKPVILNAWALATGVPVDWLKTGEVPSPDGDGTSVVHPPGLEPGTECLRASGFDVTPLRRLLAAA